MSEAIPSLITIYFIGVAIQIIFHLICIKSWRPNVEEIIEQQYVSSPTGWFIFVSSMIFETILWPIWFVKE